MNSEDIKTVIAEVLQRLCVEHDSIEVRDDFGRPTYAIYTPDAKILIGSRGEGLDALSFVIRRIVTRRIPQDQEAPSFGVDVNNYLQKKTHSIVDEAEQAARRVRMFQHEVELQPMNAFERMVVHHHFSESSDIATESTGDGKYRRVVLRLKTAASNAQEQF